MAKLQLLGRWRGLRGNNLKTCRLQKTHDCCKAARVQSFRLLQLLLVLLLLLLLLLLSLVLALMFKLVMLLGCSCCPHLPLANLARRLRLLMHMPASSMCGLFSFKCRLLCSALFLANPKLAVWLSQLLGVLLLFALLLFILFRLLFGFGLLCWLRLRLRPKLQHSSCL